jgi:pyridoxamine 5'-phosphate oxidase family protein
VAFTTEEIAYINSQHLARVASVAPDGQPDVAAVVFDFDGAHFDIGGFNPSNTRRSRNVRNGNRKVALILDDLMTVKPWTPRFIRFYGTAALVDRQDQQVLQIAPTVSWSMNLWGAWSPGSQVENRTRKSTHSMAVLNEGDRRDH